MRNAESTAFPFAIAFVWVILVTQRGGRGIVFGDVGSEGLLGSEDGVAEFSFEDRLRPRREGDVKFCGSTSDGVDEDFASVCGYCFGAEAEEG